MPKCVSLRPLLTPKRPLKYQVPKNSKKVQFPAPEKSKIWAFKAPFNSKKALGTWILQKGAFSGARKSQYVQEILYQGVNKKIIPIFLFKSTVYMPEILYLKYKNDYKMI